MKPWLAWSPELHCLFPLAFRRAVRVLFLLSLWSEDTCQPRRDDVSLAVLPFDMLRVVVEHLAIIW